MPSIGSLGEPAKSPQLSERIARGRQQKETIEAVAVADAVDPPGARGIDDEAGGGIITREGVARHLHVPISM